MGAVSPPELAAAVSEAGGLGMLGMAHPRLTPASLSNHLDRLCALTDKPFGVNFIVAPQIFKQLDLRCVEIAARAARVVEFFYGEPDRALVEMAHGGGALVSWQVGSKSEAVAAADAGCDFIVVQGVEAGGHVRGNCRNDDGARPSDRVGRRARAAAGGISTGRAMAAALAAGADGVRVGTRFVAATEAAAHPEYVAALIASQAEDTIYTTAFSRSFRMAPCPFVLPSAKPSKVITVGEITALDGTRMPALRLASFGVTRPRRRSRIGQLSSPVARWRPG